MLLGGEAELMVEVTARKGSKVGEFKMKISEVQGRKDAQVQGKEEKEKKIVNNQRKGEGHLISLSHFLNKNNNNNNNKS